MNGFCFCSLLQKRLLETFKMSAVRDFRFNLDGIPDEQRTLRTSHHENETEQETEQVDQEENE